MSKRLIIVLALAFVVGLTVGAYAEVQNVKVSGDLLIRAVDRNNFTLSKSVRYEASGFLSNARLRVDADLTDNVSATVRLISEWDWGQEQVDNDAETDIDLAYVTLKEFLYSPLTLTVGRQELRFGNGMVIGDVDTNQFSQWGWVAGDLSIRKAFEAIRATLNYDPLVVDVIYAKIDENDLWQATAGAREDDDIDLYGINARYDLGVNNASVEAYYFSRINRAPALGVFGVIGKKDTCHTVGILAQGDIIKGLLRGSLEGAYQTGKASLYNGNNLLTDADRDAFAGQATIALLYKEQPALGFTYSYFSGDKDIYSDNLTGWDPMFEDQTSNSIVNALFPQTNCHVYNLWGGIKPTEDITVSLIYGYYRLAQDIQVLPLFVGWDDVRFLGAVPYGPWLAGGVGAYMMTDSKDLGHAVDLNVVYDYTEDVQIGLTFGWFDPGHAFSKDRVVPLLGQFSGNREAATQLIGSMKVTF